MRRLSPTVAQVLFIKKGVVANKTTPFTLKLLEETASRLDKHPKVSARILELQQATEAALAERRMWDRERLISEAESNLYAAREAKQMGSANGALELIGRVTGLLSSKPPNQNVMVTKITVVTTGDMEDQRQAAQSLTVEGTARILPDEDSDES